MANRMLTPRQSSYNNGVKRFRIQIVRLGLTIAFGAMAQLTFAADFRATVQPLIDASCIDCHDGSEDNGLDFGELNSDLSDEVTFRKWEHIFDRVTDGEMPPASADRPDPKLVGAGLAAVKDALTRTVRTHQAANGRVILRRLNRTEYGYTLRELFGFDRDLSEMVPEENVSTSFDTVFANQGLSPLHIEGFLNAADEALTTAIELGKKPASKKQLSLIHI